MFRKCSSKDDPHEFDRGFVAPPPIPSVQAVQEVMSNITKAIEEEGKPFSKSLRGEVLSPLYQRYAAVEGLCSLGDLSFPLAIEAAISSHEEEHGENSFYLRSLSTMVRCVGDYSKYFPTDIPIPIHYHLRRMMANPDTAKAVTETDAEGQSLLVSQRFTKRQCLILLSCAFLCLFPRRSNNCMCTNRQLPSVNFDEMLFSALTPGDNSVEVAKLLMILEYFDEMTDRLDPTHPLHSTLDSEDHSLSFERRMVMHMPPSVFGAPLLKAVMHPLKQSIDDQKEMIRADFANEVIGGGAIAYGCVQEEIMFSICPELIVTRLIYPPMLPTEAIVMYGSEQFAKVKEGTYAFSLQYGGKFDESAERSSLDRGPSIVTAIDALDFRGGGRSQQYNAESINREILKAFAGFNIHCSNGSQLEGQEQGESLPSTGDSTPKEEVDEEQKSVTKKKDTCCAAAIGSIPRQVATGNWGCGAFLGDPTLKVIQQWIACSMAGKEMHYFPFSEAKLLHFQELSNMLVERGVLCSDLMGLLTSGVLFGNTSPTSPSGEGSSKRPSNSTGVTLFDRIAAHYSARPYSPLAAGEKRTRAKRGG